MTTFVKYIQDLLGTYEPIVDSDGNALQGIASLNFNWIVPAIIFIAGFIGCICLGRTVIRCLFGR